MSEAKSVIEDLWEHIRGIVSAIKRRKPIVVNVTIWLSEFSLFLMDILKQRNFIEKFSGNKNEILLKNQAVRLHAFLWE